MTYELCKELKNVGFVFKEAVADPVITPYLFGKIFIMDKKMYWVPTVEDLLGVCKKDICGITKFDNGKWFVEPTKKCLEEKSISDREFNEKIRFEEKLDEALAYFILALNK